MSDPIGREDWSLEGNIGLGGRQVSSDFLRYSGRRGRSGSGAEVVDYGCEVRVELVHSEGRRSSDGTSTFMRVLSHSSHGTSRVTSFDADDWRRTSGLRGIANGHACDCAWPGYG